VAAVIALKSLSFAQFTNIYGNYKPTRVGINFHFQLETIGRCTLGSFGAVVRDTSESVFRVGGISGNGEPSQPRRGERRGEVRGENDVNGERRTVTKKSYV
jgi:hypothetical protein